MNWEVIVAASLPFILGGGSVFLRANRLRALLKDDIAILKGLPRDSEVRPAVRAAAEVGAARLAAYTLVPTPHYFYVPAFGLALAGLAFGFALQQYPEFIPGRDPSELDGWSWLGIAAYLGGVVAAGLALRYMSRLRARTVRAILAGRKSGTYRINTLGSGPREMIYKGVVPFQDLSRESMGLGPSPSARAKSAWDGWLAAHRGD